jgi:predicted DNA-binding transcriptional regulator YafY
MGAAAPPPGPGPLLEVARALAAGRRLRLLYQDAGGAASSRVVSPLGLAWRAGHWLLAAHCHLRHAFRLFRVDRVEAARLARGRPAPGLSPPGFDPRFFSAEGYLTSGREPPSLATVRLGSPLARLAPVLLPAALRERRGDATLCHLRASDGAALAGLVESLGAGASLLAWRAGAGARPARGERPP